MKNTQKNTLDYDTVNKRNYMTVISIQISSYIYTDYL